MLVDYFDCSDQVVVDPEDWLLAYVRASNNPIGDPWVSVLLLDFAINEKLASLGFDEFEIVASFGLLPRVNVAITRS